MCEGICGHVSVHVCVCVCVHVRGGIDRCTVVLRAKNVWINAC